MSADPIQPPKKCHKKLVVFCDGTWNRADQKTAQGRPCPTNVARLFEATTPCDASGDPQIAHYVQGVGTRWTDRLVGGGFGYGISDNIKNAYQFICSNYEPGDDIYIFGFSRGAYTARSIAGLIHNLGILKREYFYKINETYAKYKDKSSQWHPDGQATKTFRDSYTWDSKDIRFVGVWDTVGALGAPYGFVIGKIVNLLFKCSFHDVKLSSSIKSGYHALAIDERRWPFRPSLWELSSKHNPADFEEKWFPGVHANVGGGYLDTGISDLALEWMAAKAIKHGLNIDLSRVSNPRLKADTMAPIENSQTFVYRQATRVFVKWPSYLGLVLPRQNKPLVVDVLPNGDYVRPIPNKQDVTDFIGKPPKTPNTALYAGSVSKVAISKINHDSSYKPPNVGKLGRGIVAALKSTSMG